MAAAILGMLWIGTPATHAAAPALSITPLEWNVVGLDSNNPASGPNRFHIGARVCNTGDAPATGVEAQWSWDTANPAISLQGPAVRALPDLEPSECASAWFGVEVLPQASSFDQARQFHITATAAGVGSVSTPTPREIYVERLVSQNRNTITGSTGETTATVGQTYTYTFTGMTSTTYEQLAAQAFFDPTIFEVQSVEMNVESGQSVSQFYVDACGWVSDPTAAGYRSCAGADKAGGTFDVTVRVKVIGAGSSTLSMLVYDFSGSSYHYNSDYSTSVHAINVVATEPDPNTVPNAVDDSASTDEGVP
ncbi:hypothetical protein, partial [Streptomyces jeddahensis]|uniref:hypothetical protein n=1 Tax=Streptomyces jeddahensis TaxID=1716141 RepID=UPI0018E3DD03